MGPSGRDHDIDMRRRDTSLLAKMWLTGTKGRLGEIQQSESNERRFFFG